MWPHEVELWFHSWYRGRVETLDVKYNVALFELLMWPHEVESWFHPWYRGRVETLDANLKTRTMCEIIRSDLLNCTPTHPDVAD